MGCPWFRLGTLLVQIGHVSYSSWTRAWSKLDMLLVQGEEGPEDQIRAFLWRARGEVPVASAKQDERGRSGVAVVAETLARIREEWMDEEDACSQNPEACAAMLESLESELAVIEGVGEMDEEEAEDDAKGGE